MELSSCKAVKKVVLIVDVISSVVKSNALYCIVYYYYTSGLSWARRAVARAATTVHTCSVDQETGKWTVETRMLLRENFATFKLGEETEHTTLDGRLIKVFILNINFKVIISNRFGWNISFCACWMVQRWSIKNVGIMIPKKQLIFTISTVKIGLR